MSRLYEPQAYDTTTWPDSLWRAATPPLAPWPRLQGAARAEVAIIGAGVTGLNAALELAEAHDADVALLDAAQPGWGASGRNGGFCCAGSTKLSDAAIRRRVGPAGADAFAAFQRAAVARVDDNLRRYAIDAERGPDGELHLAHSPRAWAVMQAEAAEDPDAEILPREALRDRGLFSPAFHGGVLERLGFPIQPMKYTLGLARAAQAAGVRCHGDSPVTRLAPQAGGWRLTTPHGTLDAARVLVATNGYTDERVPGWLAGRILPVLSNILVTRPLSAEEQRAQGWTARTMSFDSRRLLHYFRLLPCGRFLFGARGGHSADPAALAAFARTARAEFDAMFPRFAAAETEHRWSGLVCLTASLAPFAGPVPGTEGLFAALAWHGNGVAAGSETGRRMATLVAGGADTLPALMRRPPPRLPVPRRAALRAAMAAMRVADLPAISR